MTKKIFRFICAMAFCLALMSTRSYAGDGKVTLKSGAYYPTLEEALSNAADDDTLTVTGDVAVTKNLILNKSITLVAGQGGGKLFTSGLNDGTMDIAAALILDEADKTLTLGNGSSSPVLTLEDVHLKIAKGHLQMQDGVYITSNRSSSALSNAMEDLSIVVIAGSQSSATFEGGTVENPYQTDENGFNNHYIVTVSDGAKVDNISGGTYSGAYIAFNVKGEGTEITTISGGAFSNSKASRQSEPCFKLFKKAKIGAITGGTFTAHRFGALQLESDAQVDVIAGGTFTNPVDTPFAQSSGALPYFSGLVLYGRNGSGSVTVHKITGGTFSGENGLLAVGDKPELMAKIGEISGGDFIGKGYAGLYFSQNTQVGTLSGKVISKGERSGIWNAGTIDKIEGGKYSGTDENGITNYAELGNSTFKGHIQTICGGSFIGDKSGMYNSGLVDSISNGTFEGARKSALRCDNPADQGNLNRIQNGVFITKSTLPCITLVNKLELEPGLTDSIGKARFHTKGKQVFNKDKLVTFPTYTYTAPDGTTAQEMYFISDPTDTKQDVAAYSNETFRFLRQMITVAYNFNMKGNSTSKVDQASKTPLTNVTLWKDATQLGATPKGYSFLNWNTAADGTGTTYAGEATLATVDAPIVLYAQWKTLPKPPTPTPTPTKWYTIIVDPNGGNWKGDTAKKVEIYDEGATFTLPEAPMKEGYTFLYWKGSEYQPGEKYIVKEDHTFTAEWKKNSTPQPAQPSDGHTPGAQSGNTVSKEKTAPKTGEDARRVVYAGLAVILGVSIVVLRKNKKKNDYK
ncbi:InlB B-repeat-containing protein [Murdochiella vaginalis]|uniref:InlB B-repeat-containing protein n=1 Tax=Murdochiella vaginalis TaxID=1852373 RepID=UPI000AA4BA8B|nr:InlB B-repeat-containing protein [Murdochiella vaginalis]